MNEALIRLHRAGVVLLDWMLPGVCVCCERVLGGPRVGHAGPVRGWCDGCADGLPGRGARRCPVCGERQPAQTADREAPTTPAACARCRGDPPAFDRSIVLADYAPPLDRLVQAMKFGRQSALAAPLGRLLAQSAARRLAEEPAMRPHVVVAVPATPARLAERGFNQALLLALPVARALALQRATRVLRRVRQAAPASSLGAAQRRGALEHAVVAPPLPGAPTVLVVDDVMTTGATLQATALALKAAGAGLVVNCVAARTPFS